MSKTQAHDPAALTIYISRMDAETLRSRGRCTLTAYTERVGSEPNEVALSEATDDDDDLLTIAYMAGAHDARKAAIPSPEGAQPPPLPAKFPLIWVPQAGCFIDFSIFIREHLEKRDDEWRAALAAPAPQAPMALTDEQIRDVWSEKVRWHGPPMGLTDLEFAHDAIAEFCRVNGIKEPTNDR